MTRRQQQVGRALGARTVSFLIADLSGRALVRLAYVPFDDAGVARRDGDEVATVLPFDGGPAEQALRTQSVQVVGAWDGWVVLAPVTDRGEVIGLLEMVLPEEPDRQSLAEIGRTAHALAIVSSTLLRALCTARGVPFVVIANRRRTDLYEWRCSSLPARPGGHKAHTVWCRLRLRQGPCRIRAPWCWLAVALLAGLERRGLWCARLRGPG